MVRKRWMAVVMAAAALVPALAGCTRYLDEQTPPGDVPPEEEPRGPMYDSEDLDPGGEVDTPGERI